MGVRLQGRRSLAALRRLALRRPAFVLHPGRGVAEVVWYRGRPFPIERLPVDDAMRGRLQRLACPSGGAGAEGDSGGEAAPAAPGAGDLAQHLADEILAPVVYEGRVYRPRRR